jgi:YfiH family protein
MSCPGLPESDHPVVNRRSESLPEPTDGFVWRQASWGVVLECEPLSPFATHLFTTRDLSPGVGVDPDAAWTAVAFHLGLPPGSLHRLDQVHECTTLVVEEESRRTGGNPRADALITDRVDVALAVKTADCVPILIADRERRAAAAIHAGWRGTARGIAAGTVLSLRTRFEIEPDALVAAIGPSIGACCYQVGPEVRAGFAGASRAPVAADVVDGWFAAGDGDRLQLDLWRANREQLEAVGVPAASIHVAGLCTACHVDRFFSYRRESARAGRMLAVVRKR